MSNQNGMVSYKMTEYDYLLHLLRCGIHGQTPVELPKELSYEKVYQYAMEHDVANLAFYAVERLAVKPENDLYNKWKLSRDLALVRDMNQDFARQELIEAFLSRGILYKELQGTVLKKLYPRPEFRTMSDLDFIVEKSRLTECGEILRELGYCCEDHGDYEIDGHRRPDIFVELHTDYFSPNSDYYGIMGDPFAKTVLSETECLTELYLYSVLHTAKHYFAGGCGIRRVLDMYYLDLCFGHKVDREYLYGILEKVDLRFFGEELLSLARAWFGDENRVKDTDAMERYVLEAGLHGKRENYISSKLQGLEKGEKFSFGTKMKYLFSRLFPGDRVMVKQYPVLKKWRILYPFCWLHRIFRMLFGKNREASVLDLKLILQTKSDQRAIAAHKHNRENK